MSARSFATVLDPRYNWQPPDIGLKAWTYDHVLAANATILASAGVARCARVKLPRAGSVTNIHVIVTTAGGTLTSGQNFGALWTNSGVLVAQTTDQTTALGSVGFKTMAFAAPHALVAGTYIVGLWSNGTTLPTLARGTALTSPAANAGLSTGYRFFTVGSSLTTAAPDPTGAESVASTAYWFGLS